MTFYKPKGKNYCPFYTYIRGDVGQMHQKFYFDCQDLKFESK